MWDCVWFLRAVAGGCKGDAVGGSARRAVGGDSGAGQPSARGRCVSVAASGQGGRGRACLRLWREPNDRMKQASKAPAYPPAAPTGCVWASRHAGRAHEHIGAIELDLAAAPGEVAAHPARRGPRARHRPSALHDLAPAPPPETMWTEPVHRCWAPPWRIWPVLGPNRGSPPALSSSRPPLAADERTWENRRLCLTTGPLVWCWLRTQRAVRREGASAGGSLASSSHTPNRIRLEAVTIYYDYYHYFFV